MGASVGRNFPIWLTGTVANDPIFNYDDRPVLLVDARTRPAMSGSPVWAQTDQTYINGRPSQIVGPVRITAFVGIYSGRIHKDLDIGFVWKPYVLREVLTGVLDPNAPAGRFNPVDDDDWLRK